MRSERPFAQMFPRALCRTTITSLALFGSLALPGAAVAQDGPTADRPQWRQRQLGDSRRANQPAAPTPASRFRSFDGTGNNRSHPLWGGAGTNYLRELTGAHYADGRSAPAGAGRPGPRAISNAVADQHGLSTQDERGLSTAIYEFGQFLDHDIGLARGGSSEAFDILVPSGDPYFDPEGTGTALIYLDRSAFDPATGIASPRQQINTVTSFIDASHIYGSDPERAAWLRTFSGGRLKSRMTPIGELLPLNDGTQANDNPVGLPATVLVVAGDVRANEQPGLTVLHTAFLREHNRQAARLATLHPSWNDERLYQEARRIIGAEMQAITYNEFLPALLGRPLPPYRGYRAGVNPGLSNAFATAAYRFGHSQVGPDIGIIDEHFVEIDSLDLSELFFNPTVIPGIGGIDPIIRYMAIDHAQAVDSTIVGGLRNFLFGPPGAGGFDLASLNIQRGRDHGIGSYNAVRTDFELPPIVSFDQITSDSGLAETLRSLYGHVNDVDAWVGLLAEDHALGSSLGPTAIAVLTDQFLRLRDGDRYWYQANGFEPSELAMIESTRLADILQADSGVTGLQADVFFAADLPLISCTADLDDGSGTGTPDGVVDNDDFFYYLAQFATGNLAVADLTTGAVSGQPGYGVPDGVLTNDDFFYYLALFAEGC